jgi:hypothetical protein
MRIPTAVAPRKNNKNLATSMAEKQSDLKIDCQ